MLLWKRPSWYYFVTCIFFCLKIFNSINTYVQVEIAKTLPPSEEIEFLRKANSDTRDKEISKQKRKRKAPKQPNPLSCKKKKGATTSQGMAKKVGYGKEMG